MNPTALTTTALIAAALSANTTFASESERLLDLSRSIAESEYASLESTYASFPESLKASVQLQFRYNYNLRDSAGTTLAAPSEDLTVGFTNRRTKLGLEGKVTDDISAKVKFAFSQSSGAAALEDAVMKWKLSDTVSFRAGQFKPSVLREENLSSSKQLATDRSSVNETYNQDFTQGIEFIFSEDDWRFTASLNDGVGADNTYFTSGTEADIAFSARGELRFGEAGWSKYKQFTSFRGAEGGLMVGAAFHHQWMGETNPATIPTTEMSLGTVDASLLGDGWNLYAAGVWRSMDTGLMTLTDAGYILQGGVFVSDQNELFGRWDVISPSNSSPVVVGVSGADEFNAFTFGWNHYIIPESHAAKFTLECQVYPDATTESIVSIRGNLLSDSIGDQFAITAQIQLLF